MKSPNFWIVQVNLKMYNMVKAAKEQTVDFVCVQKGDGAI